MVVVKLDALGSKQVRFPRTDPKVLALGEAYVAKESALPAAERVQTPSLALVQAKLNTAKFGATTAVTGEDSRFKAAAQYKRDLTEAQGLLNQAVLHLKSKTAAKPEAARDWGLDVVSNSRGLSIRKPTTLGGWETFLMAYTAKENSLPPAERLPAPDLARLTALANSVAATKAAKLEGRAKRETGVQGRSTAVQDLLDVLQVCCLVLVITRHNGQVNNELQLWGFDVAAAGSQPDGAPSGGGAN